LYVCIGLAASLFANDWPAPQIREVFSANRGWFVRVTPGESWGETWGFTGANIGKHAQASFFREHPNKDYHFGT
jgi:hypothetical protein